MPNLWGAPAPLQTVFVEPESEHSAARFAKGLPPPVG